MIKEFSPDNGNSTSLAPVIVCKKLKVLFTISFRLKGIMSMKGTVSQVAHGANETHLGDARVARLEEVADGYQIGVSVKGDDGADTSREILRTELLEQRQVDIHRVEGSMVRRVAPVQIMDLHRPIQANVQTNVVLDQESGQAYGQEGEIGCSRQVDAIVRTLGGADIRHYLAKQVAFNQRLAPKKYDIELTLVQSQEGTGVVESKKKIDRLPGDIPTHPSGSISMVVVVVS
ncbi:MAG: hypothetical protein A2W35_06810 [Chloroflexi bacterium RBG_16_57_11]|nr:MAG: hypothetical protein A2W35_06810 [Chloroflexi bacterium RBG_16_57_11]